MKLFFLGTGAADWDPVKSEKGEHRRYTSALVDDILLIDPGPCVLDAMAEYNKNISDIKFIINTHRHRDHYDEDTIKTLEQGGAEFIDFKSGNVKEIGGYTISAYTANHGTCAEAVHFIIEKDDKKLFYGLDSAWLLYDEIKAIKEKHIDLAVLDGTIGNAEGDYRIFEHNNLRMIREMKLTLNPYVDRFAISHMARTLHEPQEVLAAEMANYEIEVAFDGWETEI